MDSSLLTALFREITEQPEQIRIGQLISNAARFGGWDSDDLFYCPDSTILKGLDEMCSKRRTKTAAKSYGG